MSNLTNQGTYIVFFRLAFWGDFYLVQSTSQKEEYNLWIFISHCIHFIPLIGPNFQKTARLLPFFISVIMHIPDIHVRNF